MNKQRGFSFLVVMAFGIVAAMVIFGFMKMLPAYAEYFAIKKTLDEMVVEKGKTDGELRREFTLRTTVQDIDSVRSSDLLILATPDSVGIGVRYRREVPLTDSVAVILSFEHQAGTPVLRPKN